MPATNARQVERSHFMPDNGHPSSTRVSRTVFIVPLIILLAPSICRADVATSLMELGWLLLIIIAPIEALVFLIYDRLRKKIAGPAGYFEKINGIEILAIVFGANLTSSFAGIFFHFYKYKLENLITLCIAFVLSIIIEYLVYKTYFLIQRRKKALGLLNISIIGNVVTYAIFFLPIATADLLTSFDYDRFASRASYNVLNAMADYYSIPTNTEFDLDIATLRSYGYKELERERFGIKTNLEVETRVVGNRSDPKIATWHKKGRHVYLVDKNLEITEKLKTELDDDLKAELGLQDY